MKEEDNTFEEIKDDYMNFKSDSVVISLEVKQLPASDYILLGHENGLCQVYILNKPSTYYNTEDIKTKLELKLILPISKLLLVNSYSPYNNFNKLFAVLHFIDDRKEITKSCGKES
jgi:hypothetical protein